MARVLSVAFSCILLSVAEAGLKDSASFPIGVAVTAKKVFESKYGAQVKEDFSQMTCGNYMKMSYMHPSENTYTWTTADSLVNWAKSAGVGVHGHCMVWHSSYQVPKFMNNYSGDFGSMLEKHCKTFGEHFSGRVDSWDVVNEALNDGGSCYRNSVFYQKLGKSFLAKAFKAAREGEGSADLFYNDYNIEWSSNKLKCLKTLISDLKSAGAPITGVGFQTHISMSTSVSTMQSHFKQIAQLGLKVKITELDISTTDLSKQKSKYKEVVKAYLNAVPSSQRGGITVWGLNDQESWREESSKCLLFSNYEKKPAYYGFQEGLGASGTSSSSYSSPSSSSSKSSSKSSSSSSSSSSGCTAAWGSCSSTNCCVSGYSCSKVNQYYSQCKTGSSSSSSSSSSSKKSSSTKSSSKSSSSSSSCTAKWGNCMSTGCCTDGFSCKTMNQYYKQCSSS